MRKQEARGGRWEIPKEEERGTSHFAVAKKGASELDSEPNCGAAVALGSSSVQVRVP